MGKVVHAIDGNNWANRAFYSGNRKLSHNGISTNAIHVFFLMLDSEIRINNIKRLAFAFDIPTHTTWRYKEMQQRLEAGLCSKNYKSDRNKNRDDAEEQNKKEQIEYIRKLLKALGWKVMLGTKSGDEADDILGAVAVNAEDYKTIIHSNDKDFAQLLSKSCRIIKPKMDCPVTHKNCKIVYGVKPKQVIDLLAMQGDGIDSVEGISGCGEKTALTLLNEYGSFKNIMANFESLSGRYGNVIKRAHASNPDLADHMKFMQRMIKLNTDIPYVPTKAKAYRQGEVDEAKVRKLVKKLGLKKTPILCDYA